MDLFSIQIKAAGNLVCTMLPLADLDTLMPGSKREIESVKLDCFLIIWLVTAALSWPLPRELGATRVMHSIASHRIPAEGIPKAGGTPRSLAATSSLFSKPENQKLFPLFYFAFKDDRKMIISQSPGTQICQQDKSPLWLTDKEGEETLLSFLWGWLWTETPEILALKSFSRYHQITLQVNTFLVHWVTVTYLKKNLHWKVIMVEKYSLLYRRNSCTTCL